MSSIAATADASENLSTRSVLGSEASSPVDEDLSSITGTQLSAISTLNEVPQEAESEDPLVAAQRSTGGHEPPPQAPKREDRPAAQHRTATEERGVDEVKVFAGRVCFPRVRPEESAIAGFVHDLVDAPLQPSVCFDVESTVAGRPFSVEQEAGTPPAPLSASQGLRVRASRLSRFMGHVASHPELRSHPEVLAFLTDEEWGKPVPSPRSRPQDPEEWAAGRPRRPSVTQMLSRLKSAVPHFGKAAHPLQRSPVEAAAWSVLASYFEGSRERLLAAVSAARAYEESLLASNRAAHGLSKALREYGRFEAEQAGIEANPAAAELEGIGAAGEAAAAAAVSRALEAYAAAERVEPEWDEKGLVAVLEDFVPAAAELRRVDGQRARLLEAAGEAEGELAAWKERVLENLEAAVGILSPSEAEARAEARATAAAAHARELAEKERGLVSDYERFCGKAWEELGRLFAWKERDVTGALRAFAAAQLATHRRARPAPPVSSWPGPR
eukprot:tig00020562_g11137.t1